MSARRAGDNHKVHFVAFVGVMRCRHAALAGVPRAPLSEAMIGAALTAWSRRA
jgi:hypothetical protein